MPRRNSAAQEAFISSLNTSGALDAGSGFDRAFGAGETNDQYSARLEAWKKSKTGAKPSTPSAPPAAPSAGGGGAVAAPPAASEGAAPAMQGLMGAMESPDQTAVLSGANALKQGLGQRIYPSLQGLLRARAY